MNRETEVLSMVRGLSEGTTEVLTHIYEEGTQRCLRDTKRVVSVMWNDITESPNGREG